MNSTIAARYLEFLSPTLNFQPGDIGRILVKEPVTRTEFTTNVKKAVAYAKEDWDSVETCWDFRQFPLLNDDVKKETVAASLVLWETTCRDRRTALRVIEEENNRWLVEAYGLHDHVGCEVSEDQITLY